MSSTKAKVGPPFDPELEAVLIGMGEAMPSTMTAEMLPALRAVPPTQVEDLIAGRSIIHTEQTIPGPAGAPDVILSIFKRADHKPGGVGFYHTHSGGMVFGNRNSGIGYIIDWVDSLDVVAVSVEYRLAPEHPDPAAIEDSYAGLVWTAAHAEELGFDPQKLIVSGASAGGCLAAGLALKARDENGPAIAAQMLIQAMLDDRDETPSSQQVDGRGIWDRGSNNMGWDAYLGDRRKTDQVSIYASPGRATDLSNLPPAFIEAASVEVFRDESVNYASQIWADGGVAELHVWPGAYHAFDQIVPEAAISKATIASRTNWLKRVFAL
jgi:acetyl esterase/lipase